VEPTTSELSYTRAFDPETYGGGDPTTFGLPLDLYERMRAEMPCVKVEFDNPILVDEVWCVSRHADIRAIVADKRFVSTQPVISVFGPVHPTERPGIFCQDGDVHKRRRNQIGHAFRPRALERLEARFRELAAELVERAVEKGTFDFIDEIAHPLPTTAISEVLGVPEEDREQFYRWSDSFISPFDERFAAEAAQGLEALTGIWSYALELAERKRREPADDVITVLAQSGASDGEIQGDVATFAAGAGETTRAVLGHSLHELMRNEEQMGYLRQHASDIPSAAVQEMVRIAAPVVQQVRTATAEVELHGERITTGELVAPLLPSANFDGDAFDDPRRFDLSRHPNPHLSFGHGPHKCIGRHVASLEIKVLYEELLARTSDIQPAGEISYIKGHLTRGVYSLPVTVTPA